ncbi:MAG TPA: hemerythrin domain-containing protein [Nitrospira sp.]|nr:hemerythrin domain-containing protein [Nitrospira sp.]
MAKRASKKADNNAARPRTAVQILKADHKQVRRLFDRFRNASQDEKRAVAARLFAELELHTKLEEELIYPALRAKLDRASFESPSLGNGLDVSESEEPVDLDEVPINGMELEPVDEHDGSEEEAETEELMNAAYEHHQTMDDLMQQLRSLDPAGPDYLLVLNELEETFLEHATEEEEEILPLVSAQLDVQALGAEMQRRKDDFESQAPLAA